MCDCFGAYVENIEPNPAGTFEIHDDNDIVITYNPKLLNHPTQLVSTFAHELSHYLTTNCPEAPPGGWDNWEFATDITATFLGFGIFMANSAFNFYQLSTLETQGWETSRHSYLSEEEHTFALAIFLQLKNLPIEAALPYLKPHLKKVLKKSAKQIVETTIVEDLLKIEFSENEMCI